MSDTPPSPPTRGFGYTRRGIAIELGVLGAGILIVVLGIWLLISSLADWVADRLPLDADIELGQSAFATLAPPGRQCDDATAKRYVEDVAKPLIERSGSPFTFRFALVEDPEVNAFALPGGFVAVNTGLLEAAKSGDEVAAVLAHELAHVTLRHGTRRIVRQLGSAALISLLLGGTDVQALGGVAAGLVSVAYDREQEAAADREGQRLLRAAGISPLGMAEFFQRLSQSGAGVPTLLSTHPDPGDRSEQARLAAEGFVPSVEVPAPPKVQCKR